MAKAETTRVRRRERKNISAGVAHVNASFNNKGPVSDPLLYRRNRIQPSKFLRLGAVLRTREPKVNWPARLNLVG